MPAKRGSGEEQKDRSRAGETKPIAPEDEGVERPIWKEPRPTEREAKATENSDNTDSSVFLSKSGDSILDADITDEGRQRLAKAPRLSWALATLETVRRLNVPQLIS